MSSREKSTPSPPLESNTPSLIGSKTRRGTDPAKYKTTICRNWETTGVCTFRGCTFAHGADELRAATTKSPSPNMAPAAPTAVPSSLSQTPSPQQTPQHAPGSFAQPPLPRSVVAKTPELHASAGPPLPRSLVTPGSASTAALFVVTSPPTHAQSSSNVPPPPPSYATAVHGGLLANSLRSGTTNSPPPTAHFGTLGPEHLAEAILGEVTHCRDLTAAHADANMALERAIAAEKHQRREIADRLRVLKLEAGALRGELEHRRATLMSQGIEMPCLSTAAAQAPLNVAAAAFVPTTTQPAALAGSFGQGPLLPKGQLAGPTVGASLATSSDCSSNNGGVECVVASPTDPVQTDRLKRILESLHLDTE